MSYSSVGFNTAKQEYYHQCWSIASTISGVIPAVASDILPVVDSDFR
jgi:hypothetical protein